MNILSLEHLTHSYTERKLFDDADFYLHEGDKVGVIGINGTGKLSTQKYPISSSILSAVLFPAPDIPVTITSLILFVP